MQEYLVKEHDTLWRIARDHGTTVETLAKLNKLSSRQINRLRINQKLYVPGRDAGTPDATVQLRFRGLDFKEITPRKLKVAHDGHEKNCEIEPGGSLLIAIEDHARGLKVWIEDLNQKMISVLEREILPLGNWRINIDSRQVKTEGALQSKKGTSASTTPDVKQNTTHNAQTANGSTAVEQTRVEGAKPIQAIATIYTEKNLRLIQGNEQYRTSLITSAERYKLTPQALAALVDAEAAKVKGVWQERSNEGDPKLAQGLAQFFKAAWLDVKDNQDSLLHADCASLGESALLKKRLEAKYAIDSAGAYAVMNLNNFAKKTKFAVDGLPAEDKAKLAYLLHHEGLTGALRLVGIGAALDAETAEGRLIKQVKEEKAAQLIKQYDDDPVAAYKGWLYSYTDSKINVNNFTVTDPKLLKNPRTCNDIMAALASNAKAPAPKPKPAPTTKPPTSTTPSSTVASTPTTINSPTQIGWHDPLSICTLRTANLASKKSAQFGMVRNGGKRAHQGVDLVAVPGTPIYAVADGILYSAKSPSKAYAYGNTMILEVSLKSLPSNLAEHCRKINPKKETVCFFYAHLTEFTDRKPLAVSVGDVIGKSGDTGNAEGMDTVAKGAHLHFEVRLDRKIAGKGLANRMDPMPFIQNCTNR